MAKRQKQLMLFTPNPIKKTTRGYGHHQKRTVKGEVTILHGNGCKHYPDCFTCPFEHPETGGCIAKDGDI